MFQYSDLELLRFILTLYVISVFIYPIYGIFTIKKQLPKLIDEVWDEELRDILKSLKVFYRFRPFRLGAAAVVCTGDKGDPYEWLFINTWWFNTYRPRTKIFILMHEALHVKLEHNKFCYTPIWNAACDIVINQKLIDDYGFDDIDTSSFCTIKTCFPFWKRRKIKKYQSEEYYWRLLNK
jgi:hypothetical protein